MSKKNIFSNIKQDLPASVVVFFVALPLCLGIALASGAPLFSGLIAGIIGGIVVGSLSNSSLGVSGPAAGLAVIVLTAIESLGTFEAFLLAVIIGGVVQIIIGLLKGGVIGHYFPSSVIKGMLTGIGIILFLKQIPHAVGYDADYEGDLAFFESNGENTFSALLSMFNNISVSATVVFILSLTILLVWEKFLVNKYKIFKIIPGPLVAVGISIIYQLLTTSFFPEGSIQEQHLVDVPIANNFSEFKGLFTLPDFSLIGNKEIWIIGLTIGIVASLETLLSVEATDKLDPLKRTTNTNRELFAQGAGNIISGLIGGLPLTQVIVRSSANIQSGGKSKLSAILHGIFLFICVISIPSVLNMIPLATLAAVLILVAYKLAKPVLFKQMYQQGWSQFIPFIITVIGVAFTDLLTGIAIGLAIGIFFLLRNSLKNSHFVKNVDEENMVRKVTIKLAQEVTFLNKSAILKELSNIQEGSHITIDMSHSKHIDHDVKEIIKDFEKTADKKGYVVTLVS